MRILSQIIVKPPNLGNSGTTACSSERHSSDDEDPVSTVLLKSPTPDLESSDYDSEDNIPLTQLQKKKSIVWKKVASPVVLMLFEEPHGPSIPDNVKYPYEVFLTLFTEDILANIVFQTNLNKHFDGYKTIAKLQELIRDNYVSSKMSRNRFSWLLGNIHINDNALSPNYDKLYKLRPCLNSLLESFQNCYKSGEYQSIDENMIRFKGRSRLKQYMPPKPIKRGYKVWVRADINGYVNEFQKYKSRKPKD
ncbi:hypothetical protein ILUMI_22571 [Ignelater luminosus]|uniref:PiggyBac transposable element-derived protein domain-containing protein n=1 Tax=Ignelater luminosus TaxID=2038154 RepID=A0A8K0G2P3_IGNLU|nr:hypothetical protein ILUMI_22571 [Ignelater luminosus]